MHAVYAISIIGDSRTVAKHGGTNVRFRTTSAALHGGKQCVIIVFACSDRSTDDGRSTSCVGGRFKMATPSDHSPSPIDRQEAVSFQVLHARAARPDRIVWHKYARV